MKVYKKAIENRVIGNKIRLINKQLGTKLKKDYGLGLIKKRRYNGDKYFNVNLTDAKYAWCSLDFRKIEMGVRKGYIKNAELNGQHRIAIYL